jgi:CHAT domain-containing protein
MGHDPLNLAGLALAGANAGAGSRGDDGILTAGEASTLDLDGVDLVVLSACDTARGQVASGEGVIGLVQGFRMAGARRVIASLWPVSDEGTRLLMERIYGGMLREKDPLPPAEALRRAALELRGLGEGYGPAVSSPRTWAAFVAYGR